MRVYILGATIMAFLSFVVAWLTNFSIFGGFQSGMYHYREKINDLGGSAYLFFLTWFITHVLFAGAWYMKYKNVSKQFALSIFPSIVLPVIGIIAVKIFPQINDIFFLLFV